MAETTQAPYGRKTQREPAVNEVHVLWSPDGLSCDGDTISTTAASQPSLEDIVMGAIPGCQRSTCTTGCWTTRWAARST